MRLRLAERTGFEPAEAVNLARFPSVCLKPLDHLSKYGANLVCSNIIPKLAKIVNTISANFQTFCRLCSTKRAKKPSGSLALNNGAPVCTTTLLAKKDTAKLVSLFVFHHNLFTITFSVPTVCGSFPQTCQSLVWSLRSPPTQSTCYPSTSRILWHA